MPIYLGSTKIGPLYIGSTKIAEAYLGSTKIYSSTPAPYAPTLPYLVFRFPDYFSPSGVGPSGSIWTRVPGSTSNDWYWECDYFSDGGAGSYVYGWPAAFSTTGATPRGELTILCNIIGYGNLTAGSHSLVSMDRMFANCTGLQHVVTIQTPNTLENVGGTFSGCDHITDGMLDQYTYWSTYNTNISNHSGTFTNAGADTTTGLAELNQIPVGWGGNLAPVSTLMTSTVTTHWGNKSTWQITGNAPDWTNIVGLYLFTEASVSNFAGVSMNRSRITKRNGLGTAQGTDALYFYPAFAQYTGSSSSNRVITWVATTDTPNGTLTASQGNTDMPGTLDYSTYGPMTRTYGTFDSNANVYFLFLVTNVPIANWTGLTDAYGVLYNSNYKTDGGFRYF